jgi:hypothetical protein
MELEQMNKEKTYRTPGILRWTARVWSLVVLAFVLMMIISPDPYATEPVPWEDWFLLSLWGVAILGLLVAWKNEILGSTITIVTMFLRELAWVVLKGRWLASFLIAWLFLVPPAVLFLLSSRLEEGAERG